VESGKILPSMGVANEWAAARFVPLRRAMSEPPPGEPPPFGVTAYCLAERARTEEIFVRVVALGGEESWRSALRAFRVFEGRLERHIRLAEGVLFPLFEVKAGGETGLTVELVGNHRTITQGLQHLEACLRDGRLDDLPACVRSLRGVVDEHDGRELRLLCPLIDRLLSDAERGFLGARLLAAEGRGVPSRKRRATSAGRRSAGGGSRAKVPRGGRWQSGRSSR